MGRHEKPLRFSIPLFFGMAIVAVAAVVGAPSLSLSFDQKLELSDASELTDNVLLANSAVDGGASTLGNGEVQSELKEPRPEVRRLAESSISTTNLARLLRSGKLLRILESSGELRAAGGALLKEFSASLDLLPLWKVIALQGDEASWHLISAMGLPASAVENVCRDSRFTKPLIAARELLEAANRGTAQDIAAIANWAAFENYPSDSRSELARATLRALAAGCIALDLKQHQESVTADENQLVWRKG